MKKISLFAGILAFSMLSAEVFAYIDPGTGSAIVSSLWPVIIAFFSTVAAFIVKHFWNPIKRAFSKVKNKFKK